MKTNIYIFIFALLFVFCSCDDDENVNSPDQLFRPAMFQMSVGLNSTNLSWIPIKDANYLLEVSRDSLLFTTDLQSYEITGESEFLLENLLSNTRYSVRIKCVSSNPNVKDSEYNTGTFVTQQENIFYAFEFGHITAYDIALRWDSLKTVTHIVVTPEGLDSYSLSLSEIEIERGRKTIIDLTPETLYSFSIYNNDILRGTISTSTLKENIFYEILSEDIQTNEILLKWDNSKTVTRIAVSQNGTIQDNIILTNAEILSGEKNITGLTPGTPYLFSIYENATLRGEVSATTKQENIFLNVDPGNIGRNSILIKWRQTSDVSHIIVTESGTENMLPVNLSVNDIAAAEKEIDGLKTNTGYEFRIYNNLQLRGTIFVNTSE